jgi:glycerophosphoryl diester phosphodiesterase
MTALPKGFLDRPFAHRALHGAAGAENSMGAMEAAVTAGFGIELDIQPSADGAPMVFHDYDLARLTDAQGPVSARSAAELGTLPLKDGGGTIPTLSEVLATIAGRVPLLIEIKDQDGDMGPNVGPLERAVADALAGYTGDVAVMSFNPHSVLRFGAVAPDVPRGLVTSAYTADGWPELSEPTRTRLAGIPDFDATGACFISHEIGALDMQRVAELKARGVPILCWTVHSAAQEAQARTIADQITFEGYTPA